MDIEEIKKIFGSNLRSLRKSKKMTQGELAEFLSIETHNLNRIENGKSFPQLSTIIKIINYFEISPYELFIEKNDKLSQICDILKNRPDRLSDIYEISLVLTK